MWNSIILRTFAAADATTGASTHAAVYHGAWNRLLSTVFPVDTAFTVEPQFVNPMNGRCATAFAVAVVILVARKPVFFLELEAPGMIGSECSRAQADEQMRQHFHALQGDLDLPTLIGVSAFGTRLCFYEYDKTTKCLRPEKILPSTTFFSDTAPISRWDCDVLEQEGYGKFMDAICRVKVMCQEAYAV